MQIKLSLDEWELFVRRNDLTTILVDPMGMISDVSPSFLEFSGFTNMELLGHAIDQFTQLPLNLQAWYEGIYLNYIRHNQKFPTTAVYLKNGLEEWEYSIFPTWNNDNFFMIMFHRKSRKSHQNLLQQFADDFLKDVNLGVILLDTQFRLLNISEMACRLLGVDREHALNKPMDEVFAMPPEYHLVQRSILDGVVIRNHAVSWMNNEERYELLLDSNLLKDSNGKTVGAYVIFKDVTNLRSLEQQVNRSDRLAMIGQIAAGTAHEIRNPLTSIKGFLQMMKKSFTTNGMKKELGYTDVMLEEIDRINHLVSEFLLLGKQKNITYHSINLSSVVQEIMPIIVSEALMYKVVVKYHKEENMPPVLADRELIKQVCLNICKNGIEAMPEGGTLTVTEKVDYADKRIHIEVHDTGPGIPSFVIDKIFDPFFTTKEGGTGLGLSVCQRIIHDMGGTIRASSKGFGTTFSISIPYANKSEEIHV